MKYKFPEITRIDDLLKAIEGRPEFIVAEREHFNVVNYMVSMPTSFEMEDENDYYGALRREARGIIFDKEGNLISRPFHKFFNLNERDETQLHVIDFGAEHVVLEKADGSMIRPLVIKGELFLATKMGITDIALDAMKILTEEQIEWLKDKVSEGKTPLLEYVAPTNKIVLYYNEPKLILTAIRDNFSGTYNLVTNAPFEQIAAYGAIAGNINDFVARQVTLEDREGDIIRFANGHMVKLKNSWYVRIHKTKDLIRAERNILDIIINEQLDDVLPILDEVDLKTVREYEEFFWAVFNDKLAKLEEQILLARLVAGTDKKKLALEVVPKLKYKEDAKYLFLAFDGKNVRDLMIEKVKQAVGNTTRYDDLISWMKG